MMEVEEASRLHVNGRSVSIINHSDVPNETIREGSSLTEIASSLSRWVDNARAASGRTTMFDRGAFTPPDNPYDEMRAAKIAMRYDNIVSGVAETTEAYAFQGVKWEGENADEADIFNQLAADMNLDAVIRSMFREEFAFGQFIAAKLWGWQTYTVRGESKKGNKRKKTYRFWAPLQIKILDSLKVVPVGLGPLGTEQLAWQATNNEIGDYDIINRGERYDPLMLSFFDGIYKPVYDEEVQLRLLGVDTNHLMLMNRDWVFRHTLTKPDYDRFADIRLKSCFSLLDLKRQLMQSDRASLIGSANYILLIKKGDKENNAKPEELQNLRENFNFIAKMPVIISDHRLEIDIIAPKTDFVLSGDHYDTLNNQILMRLLGTLSVSGRGQRNETQETLSSAVARVMENRRHMLARTLEREIARAIVRHPRNAGVFESQPSLVYTPRRVALALDGSYISALIGLRTQREMSRDTILEFFGLDQATEAQRMALEEERFDDIFKTQIPFSAAPGGGVNTPPGQADPSKEKPATPNGTPEAPKVSGGRGGRPKGGGASPANPTKVTKTTPKGNPSTKG